MKRQPMKHLPEELIWEILSNLPVKSLLRFRHVSESWFSLIFSAKFAKAHLNKSNSDLTHHTLIARFYYPGDGISVRSCSFKSLLDEPDQDPTIVSTWPHHRMTRDPEYPFGILGSCNGILLINIKWCGLFLWNPSIDDLRKIPCSRPEEEKEEQQQQEELYWKAAGSRRWPWEDLRCAFGYDDSTDDYKVVECDECTEETKIYSVRTDSWKNIDNCEESFAVYGPGKFVNGKLHWLGYKGEKLHWVWYKEDRVRLIVSLVLEEGKEKYQAMTLPECLLKYHHFKLEILGGNLSLIGDAIWVMKKYGVEESWTNVWKLSDLDLDCAPRWNDRYDGATPFWVTENGDVFVLFGKSEVVVFNGKNKLREYRIGRSKYEFRELSVGGYRPTVFVESLVSFYK